MPAIDLEAARGAIDSIMEDYRAADDSGESVLPTTLTSGKVYEAWVLCDVLRHLRDEEGYSATLRRSTKVALKSAPGPINRDFPHFSLTRPGRPNLELWTDVEFTAMSFTRRGGGTSPSRGDYHELDLLVVPSGATGRPHHDQVIIGVECKNTGYGKDLLRSILGVRRELSLLASEQRTRFGHWPRHAVPAEPPSCLLVYSSDQNVVGFSEPGAVFGVDFVHLDAP